MRPRVHPHPLHRPRVGFSWPELIVCCVLGALAWRGFYDFVLLLVWLAHQ